MPKQSNGEINIYSAELHNTDADAFRHAYVSGIFTQIFGEEKANWYGKINETTSTIQGQPESEENMDLWNNAVGRKYGKMTESKEELAELLNQALKNGELIITPNDPRKYIEAFHKPIDPERPVIVIEESDTGRNEQFLDLVSGKALSRATFVTKIQNGEYGGYTIANIDNIQTPMSKPDHRSDNNCG